MMIVCNQEYKNNYIPMGFNDNSIIIAFECLRMRKLSHVFNYCFNVTRQREFLFCIKSKITVGCVTQYIRDMSYIINGRSYVKSKLISLITEVTVLLHVSHRLIAFACILKI